MNYRSALSLLIISLSFWLTGNGYRASVPESANAAPPCMVQMPDNAAIEQVFHSKKSKVQVMGTGIVSKLLSDDRKGAKHQKFLLKINQEQTLLMAHNIDLAPRIPLNIGDKIHFCGEYVYHPKGGIIHWTHHAPKQDHPAGWMMLQGRIYQ